MDEVEKTWEAETQEGVGSGRLAFLQGVKGGWNRVCSLSAGPAYAKGGGGGGGRRGFRGGRTLGAGISCYVTGGFKEGVESLPLSKLRFFLINPDK